MRTRGTPIVGNHQIWLVVWNMFFPYIGFLIIPIDFHIFQRVGPTTKQIWFVCYFYSDDSQHHCLVLHRFMIGFAIQKNRSLWTCRWRYGFVHNPKILSFKTSFPPSRLSHNRVNWFCCIDLHSKAQHSSSSKYADLGVAIFLAA